MKSIFPPTLATQREGEKHFDVMAYVVMGEGNKKQGTLCSSVLKYHNFVFFNFEAQQLLEWFA